MAFKVDIISPGSEILAVPRSGGVLGRVIVAHVAGFRMRKNSKYPGPPSEARY